MTVDQMYAELADAGHWPPRTLLHGDIDAHFAKTSPRPERCGIGLTPAQARKPLTLGHVDGLMKAVASVVGPRLAELEARIARLEAAP